MFNKPTEEVVKRLIGAYTGGLLACGAEPEEIIQSLKDAIDVDSEPGEMKTNMMNFLAGMCQTFSTPAVMSVVAKMNEPGESEKLLCTLGMMKIALGGVR